ncbi:hypothetical protein BGZ63DRAFT_348534 [Mariannaea sp. PMI_226]|nr:hypothetical protein BGZ63DRAFT_348534 [Mariannaea sp. PMI_226]
MASASTQTKMLVVPPRLNLRRAGSYNQNDRGPQSSTSSRFNFNHLLFSPPPSPGLPAFIPKPKKSPKTLGARPSRIFRRLFTLAGLISVIYVVTALISNRDVKPAVRPSYAQQDSQIFGRDAVRSDIPAPILVKDKKGHSHWTISIPHDYDFPLSFDQYGDMSAQCREVSSRARNLNHKAPISEQQMLSRNAHDDYFIDVEEAEKNGLLPGVSESVSDRDLGHVVGMDKQARQYKPVCERSMTFVLETPDAGLGNTIMTLWTLYGLAKEQGRAFFIDDTRWAYGTYTDIFVSPPIPDCRPPPRHHIVPCPSQARHLVISSVTIKDILPGLLSKGHHIIGADHGLRRLYDLAHTGYQATFGLNQDDQAYIDERIKELRAKAKSEDSTVPDMPIIGFHIRHGDQHPIEYQYRDGYIPSEIFLERAEKLVDEYYNASFPSVNLKHESIGVIASDDPLVYEEPDFVNVFASQERIRLASKGAIEQANYGTQMLNQFVDETFGWEGGFFAAMFWNLGVEHKNNAANAPAGVEVEDVNMEARLMAPPSEQTLLLRSLVGRAYMMDLAVLAGASDQVVCAVSSMGCRLLAVMMGWEHAIKKGHWVNVDGSYDWSGLDL